MQAIITKYIGATNFRGSRIKATASAGSITIPWDDALDVNENHTRAAVVLAQKWDWHRPEREIRPALYRGVLASGDHIFVFDYASERTEL